MAGEQPAQAATTTANIEESGIEFTAQVKQVLDLYAPQIDRMITNVGEAEAGQTTAQAEFEVANEELTAAKEKQTIKMQAQRQADNLTYRSRNWLADERDAALSALATTDSRADETFVAQTLLEGLAAVEATTALETLAELSKKDGGEQVYKRLVVLGSLPVLHSSDGGPKADDFDRHDIAFIDVAEEQTPIALNRVLDRHYLTIQPSRVSQFRMTHNMLGGTEDTSGADRVLEAEPLDIKVITTKSGFEDFTEGETWKGRFDRRNNLRIGSRETDFLPPTVIAGEAIEPFTSWLATNPFMRPMLFAAGERGTGDQTLTLEAGSHELEAAHKYFTDRFTRSLGLLVEDFNQLPREKDAVKRMQDELLFSRTMQEYLGINDADLHDLIESKLESYVAVSGASTFDDTGPVVVRVSRSSHHVRTVEELCDYVEECFEQGGFKLNPTSMMETARNIQLNALRKALSRQDDDRGGRRRRQRINNYMEEISDWYDEQLRTKEY